MRGQASFDPADATESQRVLADAVDFNRFEENLYFEEGEELYADDDFEEDEVVSNYDAHAEARFGEVEASAAPMGSILSSELSPVYDDEEFESDFDVEGSDGVE